MSQKVQPVSISSNAAVQGALWGERAVDWARHEADNGALCEHALQAAHVAPGKEPVRAAVGDVLAKFRRADGYHLHNKFRCLIARR